MSDLDKRRLTKDVSIDELKYLRNEQQLSNRDIAGVLGVSVPVVTKLIGKQPPGLQSLAAFAPDKETERRIKEMGKVIRKDDVPEEIPSWKLFKSGPTGDRLTLDGIDICDDEFDAGLSETAIAHKYGIPHSAIADYSMSLVESHPNKIITQTILFKMRKLRRMGKSNAEIRKECGVSARSIAQHLDNVSNPPRNVPTSDTQPKASVDAPTRRSHSRHDAETIDKIVSLHQSGHSYAKISKQLGVPISTICNIIKRTRQQSQTVDIESEPNVILNITPESNVVATPSVSAAPPSLDILEQTVGFTTTHGIKFIAKIVDGAVDSISWTGSPDLTRIDADIFDDYIVFCQSVKRLLK